MSEGLRGEAGVPGWQVRVGIFANRMLTLHSQLQIQVFGRAVTDGSVGLPTPGGAGRRKLLGGGSARVVLTSHARGPGTTRPSPPSGSSELPHTCRPSTPGAGATDVCAHTSLSTHRPLQTCEPRWQSVRSPWEIVASQTNNESLISAKLNWETKKKTTHQGETKNIAGNLYSGNAPNWASGTSRSQQMSDAG